MIDGRNQFNTLTIWPIAKVIHLLYTYGIILGFSTVTPISVDWCGNRYCLDQPQRPIPLMAYVTIGRPTPTPPPAMFGVQMVGLPSDSNITKPLERKQRPGSHLSCSTFPATLVVQGSNGNHLLFLEVTLLLHPPKFNMEPIWQCVKTLYPW